MPASVGVSIGRSRGDAALVPRCALPRRGRLPTLSISLSPSHLVTLSSSFFRAGLSDLFERFVDFLCLEHAELFQRQQRGFLLGHLLVRAPGAGEAPAVDADAHFETLAVV